MYIMISINLLIL